MFGGAKSQYLICYNVVSALGWAFVLARVVPHLLTGVSTKQLYEEVVDHLQLVQTMAVLEIVHAATGLVRSPVFTTAQQVASRLFIVWGILHAVPAATAESSLVLYSFGSRQLSLNLYCLLLAWSVTEVIRYPFYAMKEFEDVPFVITWLRYTTFIVLYPLGVASELAMVWLALPELKRTGLWSMPMPNVFNFDFHYYAFCFLAMLAYAPGFPPLYMYMFKQRKKALAPFSSSGTDKMKVT